MSGWDSANGVEVAWPPKRVDGFPGWAAMDCGCCGGIQWGGDEPRECSDCWAGGWLYVHLASGTVAHYPGGPLLGAHLDAVELAQLREQLAAS